MSDAKPPFITFHYEGEKTALVVDDRWVKRLQPKPGAFGVLAAMILGVGLRIRRDMGDQRTDDEIIYEAIDALTDALIELTDCKKPLGPKH